MCVCVYICMYVCMYAFIIYCNISETLFENILSCALKY